MKHLQIFGTAVAYSTAKTAGTLGNPCVSLIKDTMSCEFDKYEPYPGLTFTSTGESTIGLAKLSSRQTIEYSFDESNWTSLTAADTINLSDGDKVYLRGILSADNTDSNYTKFSMTGSIAASGDIRYLWNYENIEASLKSYCGYDMFYDCTSLTAAPELPATTLADCCYEFMFRDCTSLTAAPELPATTLAESCYEGMFNSCTSLNYIKCLATDISARSGTSNWTTGVSSTGTFVTPASTNWSTGVSGIPSGWTRVDA